MGRVADGHFPPRGAILRLAAEGERSGTEACAVSPRSQRPGHPRRQDHDWPTTVHVRKCGLSSFCLSAASPGERARTREQSAGCCHAASGPWPPRHGGGHVSPQPGPTACSRYGASGVRCPDRPVHVTRTAPDTSSRMLRTQQGHDPALLQAHRQRMTSPGCVMVPCLPTPLPRLEAVSCLHARWPPVPARPGLGGMPGHQNAAGRRCDWARSGRWQSRRGGVESLHGRSPTGARLRWLPRRSTRVWAVVA